MERLPRSLRINCGGLISGHVALFFSPCRFCALRLVDDKTAIPMPHTTEQPHPRDEATEDNKRAKGGGLVILVFVICVQSAEY